MTDAQITLVQMGQPSIMQATAPHGRSDPATLPSAPDGQHNASNNGLAEMTPPSDNIRMLEQCLFKSWPAQHTAQVDGWLLRLSVGATKRANSANALNPATDLMRVIDAAESTYTAAGLPTIFRLSPLAGDDVDGVLGRRGYEHLDQSLFMTLATIGDVAPSDDVVFETARTREWTEGFASASNTAVAANAAHVAIIDRIATPKACVTLYEEGRPAGFGLAVFVDGIVALSDIIICPTLRGCGLGRKIVRHMLSWGALQGAHSAMLQVVANNKPAIALYRSLGFTTAYTYHYRRRDLL